MDDCSNWPHVNSLHCTGTSRPSLYKGLAPSQTKWQPKWPGKGRQTRGNQWPTLRHVFSSASRFFSSNAPMVCSRVGAGRVQGHGSHLLPNRQPEHSQHPSPTRLPSKPRESTSHTLSSPNPRPAQGAPTPTTPARCATCPPPPRPSCASARRTPAPPFQTSASPSCSPCGTGPRWRRWLPRTRQTPAKGGVGCQCGCAHECVVERDAAS